MITGLDDIFLEVYGMADPCARDQIRGLGLTAYNLRDLIALLKAQPPDRDGYRQRSRDFLRLRLERVLLNAKAQHKD